MADIDKGLPNTRTKIDVPSEEELQEVNVQEEQPEKGPVEVVPEEDGGDHLRLPFVHKPLQRRVDSRHCDTLSRLVLAHGAPGTRAHGAGPGACVTGRIVW